MIEVKNLTLRYNNLVIISNVSFEIYEKEIFCILGLNGAGKTSLVECIEGLREASEGTISLCGLDPIQDREAMNKIIGVQLQDTSYPSKAKVFEICKLFTSMYENPMDYNDLLKMLGLFEKRNAYVSKLSGGQKQRLSILLALLPNPKVLFLDELTTGLDPKARREMWRIIKELQSKGITIVLISHFMDEVQALCDRVAIMDGGKIISIGTISDIIIQSGLKNTETPSLEDAFLALVGH